MNNIYNEGKTLISELETFMKKAGDLIDKLKDVYIIPPFETTRFLTNKETSIIKDTLLRYINNNSFNFSRFINIYENKILNDAIEIERNDDEEYRRKVYNEFEDIINLINIEVAKDNIPTAFIFMERIITKCSLYMAYSEEELIRFVRCINKILSGNFYFVIDSVISVYSNDAKIWTKDKYYLYTWSEDGKLYHDGKYFYILMKGSIKQKLENNPNVIDYFVGRSKDIIV